MRRSIALTPMDAIQMATIHSAELLGIADELGTLTTGKWADAISGGMYTLKPDQVSAELQHAQQASVEDGTLFVVLVPNPDPEWEKIGQLERKTE